MPAPTSALVVSMAPDARASTETLRAVVDEMAARPDLDVGVWFLRHAPGRPPWPGALVIDDLRVWAPARGLALVGLGRVAAALRGARLRRWYARVAPTFVLLDDALGDRVLPSSAHPVIVVRPNAEMPEYAAMEPQPSRTPGVLIGGSPIPPVHAVDAGASVRDYSRWRAVGAPDRRVATRRRLGIPDNVPVVVGWGADGWLDGPDVFVRILWSMQDRHGVPAHGLWLGLGGDDAEIDRLRSEAARCGLGERYHLSATVDPESCCCGDVVVLPHRTADDPEPVREAVSSGLSVVMFEPAPVDDPAVVSVGHLDVDAAATAAVLALDHDRDEMIDAARHRLDVAAWVDRLLGAVEAAS